MKSKRISVSIASDGTGYKTRSMWLAEALGATWSRRRGYTLAPTKHAAFMVLDAQGWEGSRRYFSSDKKPYTFSLGNGPELKLREALNAAKNQPQPQTSPSK